MIDFYAEEDTSQSATPFQGTVLSQYYIVVHSVAVPAQDFFLPEPVKKLRLGAVAV